MGDTRYYLRGEFPLVVNHLDLLKKNSFVFQKCKSLHKDRIFKPLEGSKQVFDLHLGNNQFSMNVLGGTDEYGGCVSGGQWVTNEGEPLDNVAVIGMYKFLCY